MRIYIPSRARAQLVRTWAALPPLARANAVMVVPVDEEAAYKRYNLPTLPCFADGIGRTRQWIVDQHNIKKFGPSLLMLDDDLEFFTRRTDDATKLRKASTHDTIKMLSHLDKMAKLYAHGGIAVREGANRNTDAIVDNTRNLRALFYDVAIMRTLGVKFDRLPVMEDFDVALQLLRAGYPSGQLNSWAQDQPGSNTMGGCSTYRTAAVQAQGARGLAALHPGFVKVVEKPAPRSGGWNGQPRLDVHISWKKAFNAHA